MIKKLLKSKIELLLIVTLIILRLPAIGNDEFNTDVWKWKARSYDFSTGVFTLDFEKTIQKYHPGVTLMWIGTAGIKVYNLYYDLLLHTSPLDNEINTVFELHFVQKLILIFVISLASIFSFYALKKLTNPTFAIFAFLFMSFEPFYFTLTRIMHLEGLMTTFMFASFLWYLFYLKEPNKRIRVIISALFGAAAVLTKTTALFIIPFIGLIILIEKRDFKLVAKNFGVWLMLFVAFFFLIWPAMWTHPVEAVESLYKGIAIVGIEQEHIQLYFGKLVDNPGIFYYPVVAFYRGSILTLIGLIGLIFTYKKISDTTIKKIIMYGLLFSLFYIIEITIPSKKLDRYIVPVLSGLVLSASGFYYYLYSASKNKLLLLFIVVLQLAQVLILHPNYLAYYNPLTGGFKNGMFVIEPKWTFGQREIENFFVNEVKKEGFEAHKQGETLDSLLNAPEIKNKLVVALPEKYYTQLWPFIHRSGAWASILDISAHSMNSNYVMYPVWDDQSKSEDRFEMEYKDSIYLGGVAIYNVYQKDQNY